MTTKAIEAGARGLLAQTKITKREDAEGLAAIVIEAAIASGELVPASAVEAERERCAKICDDLRHEDYCSETPDWCDGTDACAAAIRALGER